MNILYSNTQAIWEGPRHAPKLALPSNGEHGLTPANEVHDPRRGA